MRFGHRRAALRARHAVVGWVRTCKTGRRGRRPLQRNNAARAKRRAASQHPCPRKRRAGDGAPGTRSCTVKTPAETENPCSDFALPKSYARPLAAPDKARATRCAATLAPQQRLPPHPRDGESVQTSPRKAVFLSGVRGRFLLTLAKESASGIAELPNATLPRQATCIKGKITRFYAPSAPSCAGCGRVSACGCGDSWA